MRKILVTGGCGYIGSHTIIDLINHDFEVISIDSYVRSSAQMLDRIEAITGVKVPNYVIDLCDLDALQSVFDAHPNIEGIIHFAAFKSVPESVAAPLRYYHNNINSLLNILRCVKAFEIPNFVFSSSCSVYGNPDQLPVTEETPLGKAESPYAYTKQVGERIIQDFAASNTDTKTLLLRYFNPGGSHPSGKIGEIPQPLAYNVIPIMIEAFLGVRSTFTVMGDDYDTRDGSCIRDYIHVMDVANAHTKSLQYLENNDLSCDVFNIGIGQGVTVFELIHAFEQATGKPLPYQVGKRRAGDVAAIYANYEKAKKLLGWTPQYSIKDIMQTAWTWYQHYTKTRK